MSEKEKVAETLQKGIRAARRGYKEPARRLLSQVLQVDPQNEEAWLWLSRVMDTPQERAECLRRVLAIHPDNRWASEQLAALEAEALPGEEAGAPAPSAPDQGALPAPVAAFELQQLACPQCGGSLRVQGGAQVKALVCQYCHSVLDLTAEQVAVVGQANKKARPAMPIELGMEGTFEGERHQVIGWIRYEGWDDEDRWRWDEWLLASERGEFRWLSYDDEEGFILQAEIPITEAFDPRTAASIPVPGGQALVIERSPARVVALAGELTWQAKVGEELHYLDARRGKARYSVEYTPTEIELLAGRAMADVEVWQAFGRQDLVEKVVQETGRRKGYRKLAVVCALFGVLGCLGALFTLLTGRKLLAQEVRLTTGEQTMGPFEITRPGRAHRISLRADPLPTNTWAVVDVSVVDGRENEFYLFSAEFWDEAGRDSEGPWHESDLKEGHLFRPDEAGPYTLSLAVDEAIVESLDLEVTVRGGVWLGRYFVIFAVLCAVLAVVFGSLGSGRSVSRSLLQERGG